MKITGRIKPGTRIWQDFRSTEWPYTVAEHFGGEKADPNTRFEFEVQPNGHIVARADGYGNLGKENAYGNGAIYVG